MYVFALVLKLMYVLIYTYNGREFELRATTMQELMLLLLHMCMLWCNSKSHVLYSLLLQRKHYSLNI